jgi:type 1 fimbriae regulatory protein FimB
MVKMPGRRQSARRRNTGRREAKRDYLTGLEVGKLMAATRGTRNEARDRCLLLLMFRHGLRVSEACRLKLEQVDTQSCQLHIVRLTHELPTSQPLRGDELKAIRAWLKQRARMKPGVKAFFVSELRRPLHRSTVNLILIRAAKQPPCPSRPTPTCYAMLAASPSPTREPTPGSFRIISVTGTFSTPLGTPPATRRGLKNSGVKR